MRQPRAFAVRAGDPAGAHARDPPGPPHVHRPPSFRGKAPPKSTHTRPVGGRTVAPRRPAGRRTRHRPESPPRPLTRPPRAPARGGSTGHVRSPDHAAPFPAWEGRVSLHRLDPPDTNELPQGATRGHRGGDRKRGRRGRERHTTARPRAPEGQPGALQEHRKGPGGANARANPERAARRAGGTAPHRRGGGPPASRQPQEARARGARRVRGPRRPAPRGGRQGRDSEVGPGSAPLAFPSAPPAGGEERRGAPAGGARRTVPFATNVRPSPVAAARTLPGRA